MHKGDVVEFDWIANGAVVNFNHHGEAEGEPVVYEKGRAVAEKKGQFQALFDGEHGWWWRNRTGEDVTITLRTTPDTAISRSTGNRQLSDLLQILRCRGIAIPSTS